MALARGHSKVRCGPLTDHTKTAIYVSELLTNVSLLIINIIFVIILDFLRRNSKLLKCHHHHHHRNLKKIIQILLHHQEQQLAHQIQQSLHLLLNVKV